jgi:glycosyltransferase involved in cell wall biosynthesis
MERIKGGVAKGRADVNEPPDLTVSVVVPTRNRPAHMLECARAILAIDGFSELIVIDQSDDDATKTALDAIADRRLRYVRDHRRGVTRGRNRGIEESRGGIVAFTDDDCRVTSEWARLLVRVFASNPHVAVVCGRVQVPPHEQGWAESFHPQHRREWQGRYPPMGQWGITANMAIRRSVLERTGAFDPMLGAGAPLRSGGEGDFLFRVLRAGLTVVNADEVIVNHYGFRAIGQETRKLIRGYGAGSAAGFFKHVRLGDVDGMRVYFEYLGSAIRLVAGNVIRGRRPTSAFLVGFLAGTLDSLRFRIDRATRLYVERSG